MGQLTFFVILVECEILSINNFSKHYKIQMQLVSHALAWRSRCRIVNTGCFSLCPSGCRIFFNILFSNFSSPHLKIIGEFLKSYRRVNVLPECVSVYHMYA